MVGVYMTFQGRSVISAVWGIAPTPAFRQPGSEPSWSVLRFFRKRGQQRVAGAPRLPVAGADSPDRAPAPKR